LQDFLGVVAEDLEDHGPIFFGVVEQGPGALRFAQ
jgi:hypothetical protein